MNFVAKIVMAIGMMSASVNAALCATVWPDPIDVKAAKSSRLENALTRYARTTLASDWEDYKRRFVTSDGRIVDNANGGISHSEGQGYGLLMAALMRDRSTFNTIWTWTKTTLLIRDDGLAAWKWSPTSHKVEDTNNATDGDILIAWALGEASIAFSDDDLEHEASHIAMAIGAKLVRSTPNGSVLLPGADGFEAGQPDGMVLNLSYWIYPAFPTLQRIAPSVDWEDIRDSGLELTRRSKFGRLKLPSEWISVHDGVPRPASGFQARFGYNAIRIPLYLAADARVPPSDLRGFAVLAGDLPPPVVDLETGAEVEPMGGGGFRLLAALARCAYNGRKVYDLDSYGRNDLYYPATLGLLSKWFLIKRYPQCL